MNNKLIPSRRTSIIGSQNGEHHEKPSHFDAISQQSCQIVRNFEELRQSVNNIIQLNDHKILTHKNDHPIVDILSQYHLSQVSGNDHQNHQIPDFEPSQAARSQRITRQPTLISENKFMSVANEKERKSIHIIMRDEHRVDLGALVYRYQTHLTNGHTQLVAEALNIQEGDNKLTEKQRESLLRKYLKELFNPFALILWVASIFCLVVYGIHSEDISNLYLGIVLIIVIFVTTQISYLQNKKSEALMDSFKNMLPSKCIVIRDGQERSQDAEKLVLGDIVKVKAGEKIPADIRLISVNEMKVDNSALTGESEPQLRTTVCTHPESLLETANVAFFGTLCKEGQGIGIVIKIGDQTMLGEIADMASQEKKRKTTLRIEMDRMIIVMVVLAVFLGVLFFCLAYFVKEYNFVTCVIFGIGILVANVPEGLLGCVAISLAITANILHKKNILVKNLEAVETLGSTSCICTDKTGTLTQNVMTIQRFWIDGKIIKAQNKLSVLSEKELEYDVNSSSFNELHLSAVLCSEAKFDFNQEKDQENIDYLKCPVNGDATETGLIRFFQPIEDIEITRNKFKIPENTDKVPSRMPFNSNEKFALTIVELPTSSSDYCVFIKGAPEKIWRYCSYIQQGDSVERKNEESDQQFIAANKEFGKNAERVIGFAKLHLPKEEFPLNKFSFQVSNPKNFNFPMENFIFTGLISLLDPPKTRVPAAILECRSAGIKVIMVTGDQPQTAASIARLVNIIPKNVKTVDEIMEEQNITWGEAAEICDAIVVHGDMILNSLEQEEEQGLEKFTYLSSWVKKPYCVFARTTPAQKLQIVQTCQKEGFVCAVTGDGVNDSPAIKQGDIGVSMNLTGSDVTKDAADMILLDDDFASIVSGVEEGRKIFDNLKKTFVYLLCSNVPEIFPFLALILFGIPLPLSNIYMLCICVGTDTYPAISLSFEEAEIDIMTRKPRKQSDHIASLKLMIHSYGIFGVFSMSCGFLAYFTTFNYFGFSVGSLFNITRLTAYKPPLRDFKATNSKYQEIYNENIMKDASCVQDLKRLENQKESLWEIDWLLVSDGQYDLRKALVTCNTITGQWESQISNWSYCDVEKESNHSDFVENTACYSTEALKYAQTSFFVAIVMFQWSNVFACKSRKQSLTTTSVNNIMFHAIVFETILTVFIIFTPGVNNVFGGRYIGFWQFGIPGLPFSIFLLIWEETRKFFIRTFPFFLKHSYW